MKRGRMMSIDVVLAPGSAVRAGVVPLREGAACVTRDHHSDGLCKRNCPFCL